MAEDVLVNVEDFGKTLSAWEALSGVNDASKVDEWINLYDGENKEILKREDKIIGEGENATVVPVCKLPISLQKKIVNTCVAFLLGNPPSYTLNGTDDKFKEPFGIFMEVIQKNKLRYLDKEIARRLMTETRVAELWYTQPAKEGEAAAPTYRVKILSRKAGDLIYPHFDEYGDFDGFLRRYTSLTTDLKSLQRADIFTANNVYYGKETDGAWVVEEKPNLYKKIPVIYYQQEEPDWHEVQPLIDRLDMLISRHGDTNDYYRNPTLKYWGDILNPPKKGEVGKTLHFETGADGERGDAEYLAWDNAPKSLELEYTNLKNLIYSMTDTPDISYDNLKSLGNLSGVAIKLMFFASILKAQDKQEVFGPGLMRRINLLKSMISTTNAKVRSTAAELDISVRFNDPLPENIAELVETISIARGGQATMTEKTAVRRNPLVENPEEEIEELEAEKAASGVKDLGESFDMG